MSARALGTARAAADQASAAVGQDDVEGQVVGDLVREAREEAGGQVARPLPPLLLLPLLVELCCEPSVVCREATLDDVEPLDRRELRCVKAGARALT